MRFPRKNCFWDRNGAGTEIETPLGSSAPNVSSLSGCKAACEAMYPACEGVLWQSASAGCYRKADLTVSKCIDEDDVDLHLLTLPTPPFAPLPSPPPSRQLTPGIFCFVVFAKEFGEVPSLLNMMSASPASLTGCHGWRVLTNVSYVKGVSDHPACGGVCLEQFKTGTMDAERAMGGVLNTWVFIHAWKHVLASESARRFRWTMKTEIDVVFVASHVWAYLSRLPWRGQYFGMNVQSYQWYFGHGPNFPTHRTYIAAGADPWGGDETHFYEHLWGGAELLSADAIDRFAAGWEDCVGLPWDSRDGKDRIYGHEDEWLVRCWLLLDILPVQLRGFFHSADTSGECCDKSGATILIMDDVSQCERPTHMMYSRYKTTSAWNGCHRRIQSWTSEAVHAAIENLTTPRHLTLTGPELENRGFDPVWTPGMRYSGGRCACPDGTYMWASAADDACTRLNCFGGRMVSCSERAGRWSKVAAVC